MSRRRIAFNLMILGYFLGGLGIWFYTRFEESTNGALLGIMLILSGGASFCAGVVLWAVTKSASGPPPMIIEPGNHPPPG
ncbi:MAG: hypothetical protein E6K06_01995 [Methanobacteriota archaeon]|nr:MAG: hypothetical protein E6K06_01995 [Euryarchaeota archaeon]